jgi:hypothetical protein
MGCCSNPTLQCKTDKHLHERRSCRRICMMILLPKKIVKKEWKGKCTWLDWTPVTYLIYSATPIVKIQSSSRNSLCTRNPTKYTYFSPPGLIIAFLCATFNNYLDLFHITTRFHIGWKRNLFVWHPASLTWIVENILTFSIWGCKKKKQII